MIEVKDIKIAIIPAGDETVASSRIRAYTLSLALQKMGCNVSLSTTANADVLVIQKKVDYEILYLAQRYREEGKLVIYDVDDCGAALWYWIKPHLFLKIIALANIITTDTRGRKNYLENKYAISNAFILPDSIDYYPEGVSSPKDILNNNIINILWFGSVGNIKLLEKYTAAIIKLKYIKLVVVTSAQGISTLKDRFPAIEFIPWQLSTFTETLRGCQLSCLMHDGSKLDLLKSNNRMITSITWGVPAIVSDTPEYRETAVKAGIEQAIFKNQNDLIEKIEYFRNEKNRKAYLEVSQLRVWSEYNSHAVAQNLLDLIKSSIGSVRKSSRVDGIYSTKCNFKSLLYFSLKDINLFRYALRHFTLREIALDKRNKLEICKASSHSRCHAKGLISRLLTRKYEIKTYKRQRDGGSRPLNANPTIAQIQRKIDEYFPSSVLEVGCGWGRIISQLENKYEIYGCDVSGYMLSKCPKHLKVFLLDITQADRAFFNSNLNRWDVLFTRGVMLYFIDSPEVAAHVINNMLMIARKKIIMWEWPEICELVSNFTDSAKVELCPIEHRIE